MTGKGQAKVLQRTASSGRLRGASVKILAASISGYERARHIVKDQGETTVALAYPGTSSPM